MSDLQKLVRDHAYWSDKVRELKAAGWLAQSQCTQMLAEQKELDSRPSKYDSISHPCAQTCIELNYKEWKSCEKTEYGAHSITFEEIWAESIEAGHACIHCQEVRKLKAERMIASRRLGAVRSAMTRVGRNLARANPQHSEGE